MPSRHTPSHDARRIQFIIENLKLDDIHQHDADHSITFYFMPVNDDADKPIRIWCIEHHMPLDTWDAWVIREDHDGHDHEVPVPKRFATVLRCLVAMSIMEGS